MTELDVYAEYKSILTSRYDFDTLYWV